MLLGCQKLSSEQSNEPELAPAMRAAATQDTKNLAPRDSNIPATRINTAEAELGNLFFLLNSVSVDIDPDSHWRCETMNPSGESADVTLQFAADRSGMVRGQEMSWQPEGRDSIKISFAGGHVRLNSISFSNDITPKDTFSAVDDFGEHSHCSWQQEAN